jgi:cobalamin-dependent methionine synthase I
VDFDRTLQVDIDAVIAALGAPGGDEVLRRQIAENEPALLEAAHPRQIWSHFTLDSMRLSGTAFVLPGQDIAAHLNGCYACALLAVTLGDGVCRLLRAVQAVDISRAVLLDTMASIVAEQYADLAEWELRKGYALKGRYLTGRFSPGYGDLPLGLQSDLLSLLNARRMVGLTVSESGILMPRKSITAVLGVADHPVAGRPPGCEHCEIKAECVLYGEGKYCGRADQK